MLGRADPAQTHADDRSCGASRWRNCSGRSCVPRRRPLAAAGDCSIARRAGEGQPVSKSAPRRDMVLIKAFRAACAMVRHERSGLLMADAVPGSRYAVRVMRLAFLSPAIQRAILAGRQPPSLRLGRPCPGSASTLLESAGTADRQARRGSAVTCYSAISACYSRCNHLIQPKKSPVPQNNRNTMFGCSQPQKTRL